MKTTFLSIRKNSLIFILLQSQILIENEYRKRTTYDFYYEQTYQRKKNNRQSQVHSPDTFIDFIRFGINRLNNINQFMQGMNLIVRWNAHHDDGRWKEKSDHLKSLSCMFLNVYRTYVSKKKSRTDGIDSPLALFFFRFFFSFNKHL